MMEALLTQCSQGLILAEQLLENARGRVTRLVSRDGKPDAALLETHQMATHGLSWMATYVEALRQTLLWARTLPAPGDVERAILHLGFAEYVQQLTGGIPISQTEIIRPADLGIPAEATHALQAHAALYDPAQIAADRVLLANAAARGEYGAVGLADETIDAIRSQFLRYAAEEIAPARPRLAPARRTDPDARRAATERDGRVRPDRAARNMAAPAWARSPCASSPKR